MASEVNIFTSNWKKTGVNVSVPQYSVDVTINWINNNGTPATRTVTLKFPNALTNLSADEMKKWITDILLREARQRLGVDA